MPVFKDSRTSKKVSIPGIEGSEVEIWNTLLWGDLEEIYQSEDSDIVKGRKALVRLIKDWNLTDEKGNKLSISEETVKRFTLEMINFLLSQTDFGKGFETEDLKKKK